MSIFHFQEAQTIADIWQRKIAGYGSMVGTKTAVRKETAKNKMKKYMQIVGEVLS